MGVEPDVAASRPAPQQLRKATTFDEARAAAKAFQGKTLTNAATGMQAIVSRSNLEEMLSMSAVDKPGVPTVHALAVANIDRLFESAVHGWSKPDERGNMNLRAVHRFFATLPTDDGMRLVKLTVKEHALADQGNRVIAVEAVELNERSPAAIWVDATVRADGLDPTSIRSVGDVLSLAGHAESSNRRGEPDVGVDQSPGLSRASTIAQEVVGTSGGVFDFRR